jgi:hypothetical protein
MNNKVKSIVKLIETLYSPDRVEVKKSNYDDEIIIIFYFTHIDDSYMTNSPYHNPHMLKEKNLEFEIRKIINDYLGFKTSGLDPYTVFTPYKVHGITINVILDYEIPN